MAQQAPFVSVAIRSYRRLPQLVELVSALLDQDYPSYEVVIIEQSPDERERHREQLDALTRDPRVRLLEYPPLGPSRARIEAARQVRGEIILFMDDDDLPVGRGFISAHAANFRDPLCMAVSGREVRTIGEDPTPHNTRRNVRLCLRYSFLKMPRGRTRHTTRIQGVDQVIGGNASIRMSAIERCGGWDAEEDHDEDSFNFRFARVRRPGEYFAFDPAAVMLRRLDVAGGLARREQTVAQRLRSELRYSHRVVRKYFPMRFYLLYPAYLWQAATRALEHVHQAQPERSWLALLRELVHAGPRTYAEVLRELPAHESVKR